MLLWPDGALRAPVKLAARFRVVQSASTLRVVLPPDLSTLLKPTFYCW